MSNNMNKLLKFHVKRFSLINGSFLGDSSVWAKNLEGCFDLFGLEYTPLDEQEALNELQRSGYYRISKVQNFTEGLPVNRSQELIIERVP